MNREHVDMAAASVGGQHVLGSAMAYHQDGTPALTPGGVALAAADQGRLWVNSTGATELMNIYDGAAFVAVTGVAIATGNFTGAALAAGQITAVVGFAADLFILAAAFAVGANHFQYAVPLKEDATIDGVYSSTASNQLVLDFERSGNNVLIDRNSDSSVQANGTCQWMAFNFG